MRSLNALKNFELKLKKVLNRNVSTLKSNIFTSREVDYTILTLNVTINNRRNKKQKKFFF